MSGSWIKNILGESQVGASGSVACGTGALVLSGQGILAMETPD